MNLIKRNCRKGLNICGTKLKFFVHCCHKEMSRTKKIGSRMMFASKVSSQLHENYEELGKNIARAYEAGQIQFPNSKCTELYYKITQAEKELHDLEEEINKIKFSSGPELIRDDSDRPSIH